MLFLLITGALAKFTIPDIANTFLPGIGIAWICSSIWTYFDTPETYILNQVLYTKEEDDFIYRFNAELAAQAEKERYLYLVNEKYCVVATGMTTNRLNLGPYVNILKRGQLTLVIKNTVAHLYGEVHATRYYASSRTENHVIDAYITPSSTINISLPEIFYTEDFRYIGQTFLLKSQLYIPQCTQICEHVKMDSVSGKPKILSLSYSFTSSLQATRSVFCHIDMHFQVQI